jgi:hypothetical protein
LVEGQPPAAFVVGGAESDGERHRVLQAELADGRRSGPGKGSDVARSRMRVLCFRSRLPIGARAGDLSNASTKFNGLGWQLTI